MVVLTRALSARAPRMAPKALGRDVNSSLGERNEACECNGEGYVMTMTGFIWPPDMGKVARRRIVTVKAIE
ncbi:hypothetical protein M5689_015929 [Euphorbia peplus]|nr:hypothetical protein M5689_015929 [Euphorbia peplus]